MAEADILSHIETALPGTIQEQYSSHGNDVIVIDRGDLPTVLSQLKEQPDFCLHPVARYHRGRFFRERAAL